MPGRRVRHNLIMSYPPPPEGQPSQPTPGQPAPPAGAAPASGAYTPGQVGYQPSQQLPPVAQQPKRPWNVTLVAVITFLLGLLDIVGGVALLLMRNDRSTREAVGLSATNIAIFGGVILVVGAIVLLLSFGLFGGSRLSRGVIAFFAVLRIALAVIGIVLTARVALWGGYAGDIGLSIIVLLLLFAGARTKAFFARG